MRRGTRVGEAYIAVTVDGDNINKDIVDDVERAEPGVEESGRRAGEKYGDGFGEESDDKIGGWFDRIADRLRNRSGAAGEEAGEDFTQRMQIHFGDDFFDRLGDRAGSRLGHSLLASIEERLEADGHSLGDVFERLFADAEKRVSGNGSKNRTSGDFFGELFGAGSRNNFLNLFGKTIGNVVDGTQTLFKVLQGAPEVFRKFSAS